MGGSAEEKTQATETIAELRERIRVLEAELEAIKITRNSYQTENGQLKKQVAMLQKKIKASSKRLIHGGRPRLSPIPSLAPLVRAPSGAHVPLLLGASLPDALELIPPR